ncbi:MAG TPA: homoserine dehydrogenase, partial [Gaiellaceae bacterium]
MASVDVPVALLGYGTVGAAVNRLLIEQADDIERATGHRLRVVKALVRDLDKERAFPVDEGVLTNDFREIVDDPSIALVAEVMGGVEPTGEYVLELLRRGKHVVSANKQLVARRGAELFATASGAGVQLRFEASVCAAIPVIKVLRESLVVTNVHRVLGIVNGTTNFVLTEMESGASYEEALREAQARGFAEADPTDDVSGADAAAKMAILATVAFNSRYELADVEVVGIDSIDPLALAAARELEMVIRLVGAARLVEGQVDVRVGPALVDRHHPLAAVEGAFNAVMLQGDAIREITLEGPGAGGIETASAVIADMASVIGTMGTGFLQNDAVWRSLPRLAPGEHRSPYYFNLSVE